MKKKHDIGRIFTIAAAIFLITHSAAAAADRVVVIPLDGGSGDTGRVRTVTSANQVWMDRNLGAHRAAIKSDDPQAYGSLYQWGRLGDGHEYRESPTTTTLSPGDVPGHGHFITANADPKDWMATPNDSLWQGESGINNPCPAGFRLPTITEWHTEKASWSSNDSVGAFGSHLKLTAAGSRDHGDGGFWAVGNNGYYWSSTVSGLGSRALDFNIAGGSTNSRYRGDGYSVRCIKD